MSSNNTSSSSNTYQWADIPKELLEIIGKHLHSRIDVFRFRAVSTSWRSIVPLSFRQSHSHPVNLPPPINTNAFLSSFTFCRLEDDTRSSACLVKVVESTSGKLQLLNPLISLNPHIRSIPGNIIHKSINLLNFRLIELIKGYTFEFKDYPFGFNPRKVVLFDEFGILVLYDPGKLGYLRFGDNNSWIDLGNEGTHYDDLMVYKDQFYVIDSLGIISWIDKSMNIVQYSPPLCGLGHLKNLIVSDGLFYVVDSYLEEEVAEEAPILLGGGGFRNHRERRRVDMKVYKLDEEWGSWVNVKSLGDLVFVLGKEVSLCISVRDFPGCQGNCIYFIDPKLEDRYRPEIVEPYVRGKLRRYVGRVYKCDNGSIKIVECFPTYKRLLSLSMNWPSQLHIIHDNTIAEATLPFYT